MLVIILTNYITSVKLINWTNGEAAFTLSKLENFSAESFLDWNEIFS